MLHHFGVVDNLLLETNFGPCASVVVFLAYGHWALAQCFCLKSFQYTPSNAPHLAVVTNKSYYSENHNANLPGKGGLL